MAWFKMPDNFPHLPEIASLDKSEKYDILQLLCLTSQQQFHGEIPLETEDIAAWIGMSLQEYQEFEEKLLRKGILWKDPQNDLLSVLDWEEMYQ